MTHTTEESKNNSISESQQEFHPQGVTASYPPHIFERHWKEWVEDSAVKPEIANLNLSSCNDARLAKSFLNRRGNIEGLVPCWLCGGIDPTTNIKTDKSNHAKPDKPTERKKRGGYEEGKYLNASGRTPYPVFLQMPDAYYWKKVLDDETIALIITEGAKKAAAGLSLDYATLALLGVWNGLKDGRLHEWIAHFIQPGRKFYLCFDNDIVSKPEVRKAMQELAIALKAEGAKVFVISLPQGDEKGMDDFIAKHGKDAFDKLIEEAQTLEEWKKSIEAQFLGVEALKGRKKKFPPADMVAEELIDEFRTRFKYNRQHKTWMQYELLLPGVWTAITDDDFEVFVQRIIRAKGIKGYGSDNYIKSIRKFLQRDLYQYEWDERKDLLPFEDGVLDLTSMKFNSHSPGYNLTWQLPRKYLTAIGQDFPRIQSWFEEMFPNEFERSQAICFAAASVKGMSNLQVFLHLHGTGKNGKSTYASLLTELIGEGNCWNGKIEDLSSPNRVRNLMFAKLAIFDDQEKVVKLELQNFKKLTGQGKLVGKVLFKDDFEFTSPALALVTSNYAGLFPGAQTATWLIRRERAIKMRVQPKKRDIFFMDKIRPELSAFTNFLLAIPDEQIREVLLGEHDEVGAISPDSWDAKILQDNLAAWVEECVVLDPNGRVPIGNDQYEWDGRTYNPEESTLFGSYCNHTKNTGGVIRTINNFSNNLIELFEAIKIGEVKKDKDRNRSYITGIRLRRNNDSEDRISQLLDFAQPDRSESVVTFSHHVLAPVVTSNPYSGDVSAKGEESIAGIVGKQLITNHHSPTNGGSDFQPDVTTAPTPPAPRESQPFVRATTEVTTENEKVTTFKRGDEVKVLRMPISYRSQPNRANESLIATFIDYVASDLDKCLVSLDEKMVKIPVADVEKYRWSS
jgi:putative DNA primase/helicase